MTKSNVVDIVLLPETVQLLNLGIYFRQSDRWIELQDKSPYIFYSVSSGQTPPGLGIMVRWAVILIFYWGGIGNVAVFEIIWCHCKRYIHIQFSYEFHCLFELFYWCFWLPLILFSLPLEQLTNSLILENRQCIITPLVNLAQPKTSHTLSKFILQ